MVKKIVLVNPKGGSGKTTIAIETCVAAQQANSDAIAVYVDYEHAFDARYAHALGLNLDETRRLPKAPQRVLVRVVHDHAIGGCFVRGVGGDDLDDGVPEQGEHRHAILEVPLAGGDASPDASHAAHLLHRPGHVRKLLQEEKGQGAIPILDVRYWDGTLPRTAQA